jgi:hypothetical protein
MSRARRTIVFVAVAAGLIPTWSSGCGSTNGGFLSGGAEAGAGDGSVTLGGGDGGCVGLQCQQHACGGGGSTTISGKVYDPAGKNPLYNVAVYVPNAPVQPFHSGVSTPCDTCDSLYTGSPIAAALTDASGQFTIKNAPDGPNIPLVIQVGKWRKQLKIPNVAQCQDNPQPDRSLTLPKNHTDPGNDIPKIAISTGCSDTLECLLARVGVDKGEYTAGAAGDGRIHIFAGECTTGQFKLGHPTTMPGAPQSPAALWDTVADLEQYDLVLLSCEGDETTNANQQALHDYATAGGRVFASHFHYKFFNTGPYANENLATWTPGTNDMGSIMATIATTLPNGQPFPKGQALAQWLGNVGALTNGELPITEAKHNADVSAAPTPSQVWISADKQASPPGATQYFSFNTPTDAPMGAAGVPNYCGRVVFSDLHVGSASGDTPANSIPSDCANGDLSPQEKALEFMLFDLSSCITPNDQAPQAPPVR